MHITRIRAHDLRFQLDGAVSDAVHTDSVYSLATCMLRTDNGLEGTGITLTLGRGNELVTHAIGAYAPLVYPDDVLGYRDVAQALAPMRIAGGEHLPNPVLFKNFIRAGAVQVVQPDAVRLAGLGAYLAVALMAAKAGSPAVPHAGDMGQLHQHLIVLTRCALGMPELPLERIPHLEERFAEPATVRGGIYVLPEEPGTSTALRPASVESCVRLSLEWSAP